MQSFSCFFPKGPFLAAPYLDSDLVRPHISWMSNKRCGHGDSSGIFNSPRIPILSSKQGLLSSYGKPAYYAPKKRSFCMPSAFSLALLHDPQGSENKIEDVESDYILDSPVRKEENFQHDRVEFVQNERVDVRALAEKLWDAKTVADADGVLKDFETLPLPVYSSIIRGFGLDKRVDPAFAVFEWLKMKGQDPSCSITPNLFIYNSLLGALKHASQFEKIFEVMEEMKSQGIVPNIVTFNTLMSAYIDQGEPQKALEVLDEIKRNGLSPSPATYSSVLLICRKMNDPIGAVGYFVKFREEYEKGFMSKDPNNDWETEFTKLENFTIRIFYLVMRQHLVNEENAVTHVFKLLTEMDKVSLRPGRVEYERLIWACTREDHYTVARELYQRIREMESDISLSVCNHVIWLMGKARKWWAALEIYEDLLDKGPEPNTLSHELIISHFNILLNAAKKKGIWRWGVRLINKMLDKGLKPGIREWNAVLVACSKASETSAAVQIFKRMVEHGERPTVLSYGALLSALEKGKLYDEALHVWEHMCKVGVKPNLHAYTILNSIYIGNGMPEMVDSIMKEMRLAKLEPKIVTFNAIITGFARKRLSGAALEWFHRMKVQNIKPNEITYEMLIEALSRDEKPRLAYEMYLRAVNEGLNLSAKAYDAVLESSRACDTNIDMNALGERPHVKKKIVRIRKNLSDFCDMADLPRSSKPFDKTEIFSSEIQGR
ncbi:pentatricopeptide repeat-containing protein At3g46610 isoform X2 [Phalaenopsis equestris]|uniref:pentatricopeptide repeat-containing protein At3g46610 isoform X2 n=1 Tax=Phalaenopsis equestris TaxID=78828 RepID=UPI0009E4B92B|nr:pentatricopeptide repeat-containing protein At3g46610 isoform X2 [Phalaenopsis equestris]XP_020576160.1 pentatricopeptide repeat-containing protein At3g46610 isoform X2 [Phalaenopsis equestris]XP_020576161.1 pentatricopeptide repeat-containing protein At3g46610 isoform X2 [Phalaenopsis equestris]